MNSRNSRERAGSGEDVARSSRRSASLSSGTHLATSSAARSSGRKLSPSPQETTHVPSSPPTTRIISLMTCRTPSRSLPTLLGNSRNGDPPAVQAGAFKDDWLIEDIQRRLEVALDRVFLRQKLAIDRRLCGIPRVSRLPAPPPAPSHLPVRRRLRGPQASGSRKIRSRSS